MSIIAEKFSTKITTLKNEFEVNKDINHQGIKGGLNENELSDLIKEVIPQKYQLTKGVIENSCGEQSNETDALIYDDEILPSYMKNDLAFIPVEAVKYNFEIKSKLNSTEIKTTIEKFVRFKSIGGASPTVLFGFSSDLKGSELSRLKKNDNAFFTYPAVNVLCTSNKSYYYKDVTEHYLKDFLSNSEFIKKIGRDSGLDLHDAAEHLTKTMSDDIALSKMSRSQFAFSIQGLILMNRNISNIDDNELTINDKKYSEIKFKIHKWVGIEAEDNEIELSFLSGISNTLSKDSFGKYLLNSARQEPKLFSICFEDMWGNLSGQLFDENGLNYNMNDFKFSFETSPESSQIIFELAKTK